LTLKFQIYENICDDHHWCALWSLDMQFNKHAVVLLPGRERWGMSFTLSHTLLSAEERVSNYF